MPRTAPTSLYPITTIFLLLMITPTLATRYPPCVDTCIATHPSASWCSGEETGRAMEECVCRGLDGRPMIECIAQCDPRDQWAFAGGLPGTCRERVFPNATEGESDGAERVTVRWGGGVSGGFWMTMAVVFSVIVVL
ncbi:hypothetical protein BJY00DRAFT_316092 [Aspergillus carlsbadensis]|nr:hypothetical protein BJY00DRAFT_316092 [Aspergillus carlsbadensis]